MDPRLLIVLLAAAAVASILVGLWLLRSILTVQVSKDEKSIILGILVAFLTGLAGLFVALKGNTVMYPRFVGCLFILIALLAIVVGVALLRGTVKIPADKKEKYAILAVVASFLTGLAGLFVATRSPRGVKRRP